MHKEPNNGSQDIFSALPGFMLYTFSHALYVLPSPSTFLSWKEEEEEEEGGHLMKLEVLVLVVKDGCRRKQPEWGSFLSEHDWPPLAARMSRFTLTFCLRQTDVTALPVNSPIDLILGHLFPTSCMKLYLVRSA